MIQCTPRGICSWSFNLHGDGHKSTLEFNWFTEQGAITADREELVVRKHGPLSGNWTLENTTKEIASAQKLNALTRTFEIKHAKGILTLVANSPFSRSFRVERNGTLFATISPVHPFTRRATIETFSDQWDFATVSFAFWLVVLTWRRAANNSS